LMAQKDESKGSTHYPTKYGNLEEAACHFTKLLSGVAEPKVSQNRLLEVTSRFFWSVERFCSLVGINGSVTLMSFQTRRKWLLHKKTCLISIELYQNPTNNNTHTPTSELVTP